MSRSQSRSVTGQRLTASKCSVKCTAMSFPYGIPYIFIGRTVSSEMFRTLMCWLIECFIEQEGIRLCVHGILVFSVGRWQRFFKQNFNQTQFNIYLIAVKEWQVFVLPPRHDKKQPISKSYKDKYGDYWRFLVEIMKMTQTPLAVQQIWVKS